MEIDNMELRRRPLRVASLSWYAQDVIASRTGDGRTIRQIMHPDTLFTHIS
jgi:hypothetical protein